eukprot:TRINITY_DN5038_c0_g2_i8.p1 TRINITY_DN5038_c0_g2~~TRINITY_DN5038_c0_g2_i8.p1  ORF type:complete len:456 (-),score=118.26 TRINITY_DN5038_c0_g2_i8:53-1393(-)
MIRRPPRSTPLYSSAASDVYKRQPKPQVIVITYDTDKSAKVYYKIMGGKQGTCGELFATQTDKEATEKEAVLGVFIDYKQFPVSGVIGITRSSIILLKFIGVEILNSLNKRQVEVDKSDVKITACDFDPRKTSFAVGLSNGDAKLLNLKTLSIENVFSCVSDPAQKSLSVTALSWQFPDHLVVGYEDGTINDFPVSNPSSPSVFIPSFRPEESAVCPSVAHIEVSLKDSFVLAAYNHQDSTTVFGYKVGKNEVTASIKHLAGFILDMRILEWAQVLVTLGSINNELSVYSYLHGDQLVVLCVSFEKITFRNPLTSLAMLPVTKEVKEIYKVPQEHSKGDIIACGMRNGTILTAYLDLKFGKEKVLATINPQKLYKTQETAEGSKVAGITAICVDPVTDNMLVGDAKGNVVMFGNAVTQILNPAEAKRKEEEKKKSCLLYTSPSPRD